MEFANLFGVSTTIMDTYEGVPVVLQDPMRKDGPHMQLSVMVVTSKLFLAARSTSSP